MTNASHRKAWLKIAEAYATPRYQRSGSQKHITLYGLCNAALHMSLDTYRISRLNNTTYKIDTGFWWPPTSKNEQYRALSAMLIAEIGPDEFRRIREE